MSDKNENEVILENANPESNEQNIDTADVIKNRVEEDLKKATEDAVNPKDLEAELKLVEDKYIRLYAEFDNFRKRSANERIEWIKTSNQELLVSLLPVLDDFDRAQKSMAVATDIAAVKEGVELIRNKFYSILQQKGLKPMDTIGIEFDSEFHEAITKIPAPSADQSGKIINEVEKGYYLHEKVIRFAKVVVGE